jgi:hypothetical protein
MARLERNPEAVYTEIEDGAVRWVLATAKRTGRLVGSVRARVLFP